MSAASLTDDAELAELQYRCAHEAEKAGPQEPPFVSAALALQLVAEVRRLRSDEWLQRAAREVSRAVGGIDGWRNEDRIVAILRKHRDGPG